MKVLVWLACLSAGCLALKPQPCSSPPQLTGSFIVSTSYDKLPVYGKYAYDALGKRIRLREIGSFDNKTSYDDVLLLYNEQVLYKINYKNRTCTKMPLNAQFHPLVIPKESFLLGQVTMGTDRPRMGLLVNTWVGEMHMETQTGKYVSTVTEFGCIPISTVFHTGALGWTIEFFDNVIGIKDRNQLTPPDFCMGADLVDNGEDPATFFSLF